MNHRPIAGMTQDVLQEQEKPLEPTAQSNRSLKPDHHFSQVSVRAQAPRTIQTKLTVNEPGDPYEREADRVTDQVMRWSYPQSQSVDSSVRSGGRPRWTGAPSTEDLGHTQASRVQSSTTENITSSLVPEVLSSGGRQLDPAVRSRMERRLGHDFSHVRVHTDAKAAESAQAVNAFAYTVGRDIVFGDGQYAPTTNEGQRLLSHELVHVVQQTSFTARDTKAPDGSSVSSTPPAIQRQPRESATAPCPGTKYNRKIIAAGPGAAIGVGNPKNIGTTTLRIICYDESGVSIKGTSLALLPGESKPWFDPARGTYMIGFICEAEEGEATLEYDMAIS